MHFTGAARNRARGAGQPGGCEPVVPTASLRAQCARRRSGRRRRCFDDATARPKPAATRCLARLLLAGCSRSGRRGSSHRGIRRYGAWPAHDRSAAGDWRSASNGWARRHLGMIVQTIGLHRRGRAAAPDAQLRPHRRIVRARARVQRRRRRRPAARRRAAISRWSGRSSPSSRGLRARWRSRPSPSRFSTFPTRSRLLDRHPWLHAVPLLAAVPLVGPALDDGPLSGGCGLRWLAGGLGRDASGRLLRRVRVGARAQRPRRRRRCVSLPLQPQRERAPPHPHGALHGRPRRSRLRRARRHSDRGAALRHRRPGVFRARCGSCSMASSSCRRSAWSTPSASRTCSAHASCCGAACSTRSRTAR